MDEREMLDQLEDVAKGLDIEVRYETMRKESRFNPGGLCRIRGRPVIIVNRKAGLEDQINVVASAIKRFDLDTVFLRPGLRDFLDRAGPGRTLEEEEIEQEGGGGAGNVP